MDSLFDDVIDLLATLSDSNDPLLFLNQLAHSKEDSLFLYALYRQITEGPCPANSPRPSFFDFKGRAQRDAWKALGDLESVPAKNLFLQETLPLLIKEASNNTLSDDDIDFKSLLSRWKELNKDTSLDETSVAEANENEYNQTEKDVDRFFIPDHLADPTCSYPDALPGKDLSTRFEVDPKEPIASSDYSASVLHEWQSQVHPNKDRMFTNESSYSSKEEQEHDDEGEGEEDVSNRAESMQEETDFSFGHFTVPHVLSNHPSFIRDTLDDIADDSEEIEVEEDPLHVKEPNKDQILAHPTPYFFPSPLIPTPLSAPRRSVSDPCFLSSHDHPCLKEKDLPHSSTVSPPLQDSTAATLQETLKATLRRLDELESLVTHLLELRTRSSSTILAHRPFFLFPHFRSSKWLFLLTCINYLVVLSSPWLLFKFARYLIFRK